MNHPDSKKSRFDFVDSPKREFQGGSMTSVAKWARGLSLTVIMASMGMAVTETYAAPTEAASSAEPWAGKTFSCYASDKKEAEKVAAETFKAKFGKTKEEAGVGLAIEFNESTGKAKVTVVIIEPKTEPWADKTFSCYASDKKEAEKVAAETFKAKFGKTKEEAGVGLAIEFNESTGKATVKVNKKVGASSALNSGNSEAKEKGVIGRPQKTDKEIREELKKLYASDDRRTIVPNAHNGEMEMLPDGALSFEQWNQYVDHRKKAIENCIASEQRRNPNLHGKLELKVTIGKDGKVTHIKFTVDTLRNETVKSNLENMIKGWSLPKLDKPVTYPLPLVFQRATEF